MKKAIVILTIFFTGAIASGEEVSPSIKHQCNAELTQRGYDLVTNWRYTQPHRDHPNSPQVVANVAQPQGNVDTAWCVWFSHARRPMLRIYN